MTTQTKQASSLSLIIIIVLVILAVICVLSQCSGGGDCARLEREFQAVNQGGFNSAADAAYLEWKSKGCDK